MNPGSKRELTIETPLAILLTLAPWGYDQLGLPHAKAAGYVAWAACVALLFRILRISGATLVNAANVAFKEASALNWWRRLVIRYDLAGMQAYFSSLGVPVPKEIPPVTVHEGGQAIYSPPPVYRGKLQIPRLEVTNRRIVTHIYAAYVMNMAFPDQSKTPEFSANLPHSLHQVHLTIFFSADLRRYFHASYSNSIGDEAHTATFVLWRIREVIGRKFADKLASKVYSVAVDSLAEIADPDFWKSLQGVVGLAAFRAKSFDTASANSLSCFKARESLSASSVKTSLISIRNCRSAV